MTASQSIRLFGIFLPLVKEESKAREIIISIEEIIENKFDNQKENLATKKDIADTKKELSEVKSEVMKAIYIVGLIQFLAIVGSVLGILSFMLK